MAYSLAGQIHDKNEQIAAFKSLWKHAAKALPEEPILFDIINDLALALRDNGDLEASKVFLNIALDGKTRVLGEEHVETLSVYNQLGGLYWMMEDWESAHDCLLRANSIQEKVLGKTHPTTLNTVMNIANVQHAGFKNFYKADEIFMQALDGYVKTLGMDHEDTKRCAKNLGILYLHVKPHLSDARMLALCKDYPFLLSHPRLGPQFVKRTGLRPVFPVAGYAHREKWDKHHI